MKQFLINLWAGLRKLWEEDRRELNQPTLPPNAVKAVVDAIKAQRTQSP